MYTFKRIEGISFLMNENGDLIEVKTNNKFNHKFFDGDVVMINSSNKDESNDDFELELIKNSKYRDNFIIGRFSTFSRVINGIILKNKKKFTVYMVSPLNKNLPKFKVPFGGKLTGELIIKFKYSNWNEDIPFGEITSDGEVFECNDLNFERTILHHYNLYQKNKDLVLQNEEFKRRIESKKFNPLENSIERRKFGYNFKRFIFSVDPENCEDVDDTFSYYENNEFIELGIHIAQPTFWLTKEDLDNLNMNKFSTLYSSKRIDLYGQSITLASSLKEGIEKPAYSIIYKYNKQVINNSSDRYLIDDFEIELFPSLITVDKNFSYDSSELKSIEECIKLKNLTDKLNSKNNDYHDIVEFWMIQTNSVIGSEIQKKYNKVIPYRVNDINIFEQSSACEETPENIYDAFNFRNMNKAIYKFPIDSEDICFHHSLQISKYCHFTSPIRRIIDTYIHLCITYGIDIDDLNIELINQIEKNTKKFHNELEYKDKLNKLIENKSGGRNSINLTLWIYNIINKNFIEVYIEEIGIFKKINIINPKFLYRASNYELSKNMIKFTNPFIII